MLLNWKIGAVCGLFLTLVFTTACMKPKEQEKAKEKAKEMCNQVARICKDGSTAIKDSDISCYQKCPEDITTQTNTVTNTQTSTVTNTNTVTQTNTNTAN
jgi:hypothetical protein